MRTKACACATSGRIASALAGSFSSARLSAAAVATACSGSTSSRASAAAASGPSNSPSASADLLAHAGVGIADHARRDALTAPGSPELAELDDRHAPLAGVGGLQPLADVVEIVVGFEQLGHGVTAADREC